MFSIITISRQYGAAGTTIGKKVSEALGYDLLNKAIILRSFSESNIDIEDLIEFDEKLDSDFAFGQSLFEFTNKSRQIYDVQRNVIRSMAEKGKCVIIGRNANFILKEFDNVLNILLVGDEKWRIKHMEDMDPKISEHKLLSKLRKIDKLREKYCYHFSRRDFLDATNYDLCLNVSHIGIDRAAQIIIDYCKIE